MINITGKEKVCATSRVRTQAAPRADVLLWPWSQSWRKMLVTLSMSSVLLEWK